MTLSSTSSMFHSIVSTDLMPSLLGWSFSALRDLICWLLVLFPELNQIQEVLCACKPDTPYTPLTLAGYQVLQGAWSIWNWVLCTAWNRWGSHFVFSTGWNPVFSIAPSIKNAVFFFNLQFWHLCQKSPNCSCMDICVLDSVFLFLHQHHAVCVTMALTYNLKSDIEKGLKWEPGDWEEGCDRLLLGKWMTQKWLFKTPDEP